METIPGFVSGKMMFNARELLGALGALQNMNEGGRNLLPWAKPEEKVPNV